MTEHLDTPTLTGRRGLSGRNKVGLGLAAVLGLLDISGIFGMSEPPPGAEGPPPVVLIGGAILGLITIAAVIYTWRTGNRIGARVVAGTRILSLLAALPAFFVEGVPGFLVAQVAVFAVLTVVAVGLVLSRPGNRRRA